MDFMEKLIMGLFAFWVVAMAIGLIIALAPVILFVVGFFLMLGLLMLIGRLVSRWFL